jgi:hypothetical protein
VWGESGGGGGGGGNDWRRWCSREDTNLLGEEKLLFEFRLHHFVNFGRGKQHWSVYIHTSLVCYRYPNMPSVPLRSNSVPGPSVSRGSPEFSLPIPGVIRLKASLFIMNQ